MSKITKNKKHQEPSTSAQNRRQSATIDPLLKDGSDASTNSNTLEPSEGQPYTSLRNTKASDGCPSLCYEEAEDTDQEDIDRAFDGIFEEIIRLNNMDI